MTLAFSLGLLWRYRIASGWYLAIKAIPLGEPPDHEKFWLYSTR